MQIFGIDVVAAAVVRMKLVRSTAICYVELGELA